MNPEEIRCNICGGEHETKDCPNKQEKPQEPEQQGPGQEKDDFPNRVWPTDDEKDKGPKI